MKVETKKKPVEFVGKDVFLAGTTKKIGTIVSRMRGMSVDIVLSSGQPTIAQFGTMKNGQFVPYCEYSCNAGYYVRI
mgnify:CR=1 FL=1